VGAHERIGVVSAARDEVLGRIRSANGPSRPVRAVERGYRAAGEHPAGSPEALDLLEDRLVDYKAAVRRCDTAGLAATVTDALAAALPGGATVVLPPGLPEGWAPGGVRDDGSMTAADLDGVGAVVTACTVACAETGTIVLDASPDQGRRAITLVPDVHLCVVRADQVVQTVPEMLARIEPTRPVTFVSGPSATSDIELDRVEGVHGPRTLSVVLVTG
jgi:L-lactate dehydrogenase complex protein LldG